MADIAPRSLSDCIDAVNAAFGLTAPEVKFSVAPAGPTVLKTAVGSSSSSYVSSSGISGYGHDGGAYAAPVKVASYEPAVTYAKGGSITYADKSPASKFAAVVPSGIEFKNLVTPVISTKKVSNAYLPPAVSTGYTYNPPSVAKTYTSSALDLSKVAYLSPPVTTKIQTFSSPAFAKVEGYSSSDYSKAGNLESVYSSGGALSYAPKLSYVAPSVSKLNTLSTHSSTASFVPSLDVSAYGKSSGGISHQYVSAPAKVATYAAPLASHYISSPAKLATYSAAHLAQGGVSHQYVSKPAAPVAAYVAPVVSKVQAAYMAPAVAKVATYAAPAYVAPSVSKVAAYSAPAYVAPAVAKVATYTGDSSLHYSSGAGAVSHQYAAPVVAKVASYTGESATHYSSSGDIGGALSHQYVSKPTAHLSGYVAPSVAKVVTYAAPAVAKVATYSSDSSAHLGGAISHQYVSKPSAHITGYAAPAVAKVAYAAPAVVKVGGSYAGESSAHFSSSGGGAVSRQYVSKPTAHITGYAAAPAVATYSAPIVAAPAISKVATYSAPAVVKVGGAYAGESSAHFSSSGGGAVSHQYVSKPTAHITGYAGEVAVAKVATYSAPAIAKTDYSSGLSGAISHQYVSKPAPQSIAYAAPAVAKVVPVTGPAVVTAPAAVKVAAESLHYSTSGGGVSHQYVSRPAAHVTAYAAPAVAKIATLSSPAVSQYVSAPVVSKVATYSGESLAHYGSSGGGALSHQYVSKPAAHITGYAAPAVPKVAAYSAPVVAAPAIAKVSTYSAPAIVKVGEYAGSSSAHFGGAVSHQYVSKPSAHVTGYAAPIAKSTPVVAPVIAAPAVAKVATYAAPAVVKVASYAGDGSSHFGYGSAAGHGAVSHQYVSKPSVGVSPAFAQYGTGSAGHSYGSLHTQNVNPLLASSSVSRYGTHGIISQQYLAKPVQLGQYGVEGGAKYASHGAVSHQYVSKPAVAATVVTAPALAKVSYGGKLDTSSLHTSSIYEGTGHGGTVSQQYVSKTGPLTSPIVVGGAGHLTTGSGKYSLSSGYVTSGAHGALSHQYVSQPSLVKEGHLISKPFAAPSLHLSHGGGAAVYTTGSGALSHQHISKQGLGLTGGIHGGGLHSIASGGLCYKVQIVIRKKWICIRFFF